MQNYLYEIPIRVKTSKISNDYINHTEALVNCYVSAQDHLTGLEIVVKQLTKDGYYFVDIISEIREICPEKWQDIFSQSWKDIAEYLPNRDDIVKTIKAGGVVYSPFIVCENE
jgi:hypothetical protein